MGAVFAACDMAAERRRAAVLDRRHHFQLAKAHMAGVGLTPSRAMVAEDIRDLQGETHHENGRQAGASLPAASFIEIGAGLEPSRSNGLVTSRIVLTATRV